MSTEARSCCARPRAAARGFAGSGLGLALAVGAALLPKCPLCLAGYLAGHLALLGTAGAAGVLAPILAPLLAPLAAILALGSLTTLVVLARRARAR